MGFGGVGRTSLRGWQVLVFSWIAFFSTHFARMNWTTLMPFAEGALGLTKTMSGLLVTAPFATYALMQIPAGILADRIDNRRLMGTTLIAMGALTCLTGFFSTFTQIFIMRLMTGFAASFVFTPSLRLLSLSFKREKKGKAIGIFFTAPTFALIVLGIIMPPLAVSYGWHWGFFISGIPGAVTGIYLLSSSEYYERGERGNDSRDPSLKKDTWKILTNRNLLLCFLASFLTGVTVSGPKVWLLDYLIVYVGFAAVAAGLLYSGFNFVNVLNKPMAGWASDRAGKRKTLAVGALLVTALIYFLVATQSETSVSTIVVLCLGVMLGFHIPAGTALVTEIAAAEVLGVVLATRNMMAMMAYVVQPPLTGYLLDTTGLYAWIWIICGIASLLSALSYALVREQAVRS